MESLQQEPAVERRSAQTVDAAIEILELLDHEPSGLSVSEISRRLGRSRGATYPILASLLRGGLVAKDRHTGALTLGPRLLQLARHVQRQSRLVSIAGPFVRQLRDRFGETVFLSVISGLTQVCIDEAESRSQLKFAHGVGATNPLHTGATGRALLATLPVSEREAVFRQLRLERFTDLTITDLDELRRRVQEVEEQGYTLSFGEYIPGIVSISCPIHSRGGAGAALTILGPRDRFSKEDAERVAPSLMNSAVAISELL